MKSKKERILFEEVRIYIPKSKIMLYSILIFIAVILDIFAINNKYFIEVTESYAANIFSAIVTISVLCISLIALISNIFDKKYYGYKVSEIIQFRKSTINFKSYFVLSLGSIMIATFLFFLNYKWSLVNVLTSLLFIEIILNIQMSLNIFKIISDDSFCYDLVKSNYKICMAHKSENTNNYYKKEILRLFSALNHYVNISDKNRVDEVVRLICELNKSVGTMLESLDVFQFFYTKLKEVVYPITNRFGYYQMIKYICEIKNTSNMEYSINDLFIIPLNKIRFWDDEMLLNNDYLIHIIELDNQIEYKKKDINDLDVRRMLYKFFENIIENQKCSKEVKDEIIRMYINKLSQLYWKDNDENTKPVDCKILLEIFVYYVLKNKNKEQRENLNTHNPQVFNKV